jgi:Tfp pilus assembly protein PilZ
MEETMNKRLEMRRSLRLAVEVASSFWDTPLDLFARDLSPRGLFLESENMPEIGDQLLCSFNLWHGNRNYCLFGEVNRVNWHRRKTDRGRPGFGVQFSSVRPIERLRIRSAIHGLPPPTPSRKRGGLFDQYLIPLRTPVNEEGERVLDTFIGNGSTLRVYY